MHDKKERKSLGQSSPVSTTFATEKDVLEMLEESYDSLVETIGDRVPDLIATTMRQLDYDIVPGPGFDGKVVVDERGRTVANSPIDLVDNAKFNKALMDVLGTTIHAVSSAWRYRYEEMARANDYLVVWLGTGSILRLDCALIESEEFLTVAKQVPGMGSADTEDLIKDALIRAIHAARGDAHSASDEFEHMIDRFAKREGKRAD